MISIVLVKSVPAQLGTAQAPRREYEPRGCGSTEARTRYEVSTLQSGDGVGLPAAGTKCHGVFKQKTLGRSPTRFGVRQTRDFAH